MPLEISVPDDPSEIAITSGNTGWHMSRTSHSGSNLGMLIKIAEFDWSRPEDVGSSEGIRAFYLANKVGEEIWLTGEIKSLSNKRYEIVVFSGYWVVDRTGLRLGFCENPKDKRRRSRAKQGNRRVGLGDEAQNLAVLDFKVSGWTTSTTTTTTTTTTRMHGDSCSSFFLSDVLYVLTDHQQIGVSAGGCG